MMKKPCSAQHVTHRPTPKTTNQSKTKLETKLNNGRHVGLFVSLTLAQIGVQGRKQGYF